MRALADAGRIRRFMRALGRAATSDTRVFFTGGTTAVLLGWRTSTIDVDLKIIPESDGLLRSISQLKESLQINVELAAPDDFIPVSPGWQDRSLFIAHEGRLAFFHFDPYAQALAKVERGHDQDGADVAAMIDLGLIEPALALEYFAAIEPQLYRYPAVDPASFRRAVEAAFAAR